MGVWNPLSPILVIALTEIVDKDDTEVSLNDYSKSVTVALGGTYSGEILKVTVYASELGTGSVPANSGTLYLFDTNPTVASGDTALAAADWPTAIAQLPIDVWKSDANGGMCEVECSVPFHALANLYLCFRNLGQAINDAAGDDEEIHARFWWRRES